MTLDTLEQIFLWTLVVNTAVYAITALASLLMKEFIYRVNRKLYDLDRETVARSIQGYFTHYKLLITIFNFAPWMALVIVNRL